MLAAFRSSTEMQRHLANELSRHVGRREPMGVTTWETSFVVYTELRLDAYESNATRGVSK